MIQEQIAPRPYLELLFLAALPGMTTRRSYHD